jgi:hypothetical protein
MVRHLWRALTKGRATKDTSNSEGEINDAKTIAGQASRVLDTKLSRRSILGAAPLVIATGGNPIASVPGVDPKTLINIAKNLAGIKEGFNTYDDIFGEESKETGVVAALEGIMKGILPMTTEGKLDIEKIAPLTDLMPYLGEHEGAENISLQDILNPEVFKQIMLDEGDFDRESVRRTFEGIKSLTEGEGAKTLKDVNRILKTKVDGILQGIVSDPSILPDEEVIIGGYHKEANSGEKVKSFLNDLIGNRTSTDNDTLHDRAWEIKKQVEKKVKLRLKLIIERYMKSQN